MISRSNLRIRRFGYTLLGAALLSSACAGKAEQNANHQPSTAGSGSGGSSGSVAAAGAVITDDAGATNLGDAGAAAANDGGATASGGSAAAGVPSSAGSTQVSPCEKVSCPFIPSTCKHIVQGPQDCCPTCTDTGCDTCPEIDCEAGTHSETKTGECCPSCVIDPPDACVEGQKKYADLRALLLDKYSSPSCKNSTQCALVNEDNSCAYSCNIALPSTTVSSFVNNVLTPGNGYCETCQAPAQVECEPKRAACVNGKCIAAEVQ
ncbi:MAG: hypothetical protein WDO74_32235 [Pseudomonadota bacterium]